MSAAPTKPRISAPSAGGGGVVRLAGAALSHLGIYLVALLVTVIGIVLFPSFKTAQNIVNVVWGVSVLGLVAAGMAFVTYSGHFADLSVVAVIAFSGNIAITCLPLGLLPAIVIGVAAGMAIGLLNGLVVGYLRANPILWTLAVTIFMEGLQRFLWGNRQVYPDQEPGTAGAVFVRLFGKTVAGIPLPVIVMIVLFVIFHLVMKRTRFGLQTKYVGASFQAARYSGINAHAVTFLCFLLSSFSASVAGIFMSAMSGIGAFYLGAGYDFRALTAIVIGGVMLAGARGHMFGVLGGVLTIGVIINLMTFLDLKFYQQNIVTGVIFIVVVWIYTRQELRRGRSLE